MNKTDVKTLETVYEKLDEIMALVGTMNLTPKDQSYEVQMQVVNSLKKASYILYILIPYLNTQEVQNH